MEIFDDELIKTGTGTAGNSRREKKKKKRKRRAKNIPIKIFHVQTAQMCAQI